MKTADFFYNLPEELIAQHPVEPRDSSRMMVLNKKNGKIEHRYFHDLTEYLNENDCLILNNTRVIPARHSHTLFSICFKSKNSTIAPVVRVP